MTRKRIDKKFTINTWVRRQDKDIFRKHCYEFHLSMMFVGEKYLTVALTEFPDKQLEEIIETRLERFIKMRYSRDEYESIGIRVDNRNWQKLAYFAVLYKTTVAKVASCIFDYCLSAYELKIVEEFGLEFKENKRKRTKELGIEGLEERLSDY